MANLKDRLSLLERRRGPQGTIRLDDERIDSSWLYAGGDPGFEWDWLSDPAWRAIRHDDTVTLYRHRESGALRAVGIRRIGPPTDAIFL